jgi:lactate permease
VTLWTAVFTGSALTLWGLFGVYLLLYWFGNEGERSLGGAWTGLRPVVPFALLLGVVTGGVQFTVARFFGPELPNITAGFAALGVGVLCAQYNILTPQRPWRFAPRAEWRTDWLGGLEAEEINDDVGGKSAGTSMPVLLAWLPYMIVAVVLLVTRWPGFGVRDLLQAYSLDIDRILGQELAFSLRYLYLPGIVPFIPVAMLTALLHRMAWADVGDAWRASLAQVLPVTLTLMVAVSMTQIMIRSAVNPLDQPGMMEALSQLLAQSAGQALPFIAPWLGALGAFITGSSTSSNILFSVLQHDAAGDLGISRTLVVALQNVGSGIGNMTSILNIAAICGVIRMTGMEGDLLRKILLPTVIYATVAGLAGLGVVAWVGGLY